MGKEIGPFSRQARRLEVNGRQATVRLEPPLWKALDEICAREARSIAELASKLDTIRRDGSLTSMIRLFVVAYYRAASTRPSGLRRGFSETADEDDGDILRDALESLEP